MGSSSRTGSIDTIVERAGEALAEPHAGLHEQIRSASAVNVDETGWRTAGGKRTLWAALTPTTALFRIAPDRHWREAQALLGADFHGIACTDRWWAYDYLDPERRQVCWSHLVRDFTAHSEGLAAQKQFGERGLAIAGRVFAAWDELRASGDQALLIERVAPLEQELRALLEQAARKSTTTKYHRLFARNLRKRWPALWTCTLVDGVEPTNNHAERGLRGAVIYRKLSLGSQSERGSARSSGCSRPRSPVAYKSARPDATGISEGERGRQNHDERKKAERDEPEDAMTRSIGVHRIDAVAGHRLPDERDVNKQEHGGGESEQDGSRGPTSARADESDEEDDRKHDP